MKNLKFFSNRTAFTAVALAVVFMTASFQSNKKETVSFAKQVSIGGNKLALTNKTEMRGSVVWGVVAAATYVADLVDLHVNGLTWTMCYAPDFEKLANKANYTKERRLTKF